MPVNFDEIIDRSGTNAVKIDASRVRNPELPEDFLPLWIADMDFASPEPVLEAMRRRLDRRILGYTNLYEPSYFQAVTGWMQRRFGWTVDPDSIVYSCGVVTALNACVERLTKPGDGVIVMTPAYHPFESAIDRMGRTRVYTSLKNDRGYYTIDFDDLAAKAKDERNTLLFLCSPQNPTGRVFTEAELRRVGEICFSHNVFVVSDEIHADLVRTGVAHIPFQKLFPDEKRLIVCTAPSKTFNIAGNQHANIIIADPALCARWKNGGWTGMPNALSVDATAAAYNACEGWLEELKAYLEGNFRFVDDFIKKNLGKAVFRIPEGTYLAWVDLSAYGASDTARKTAVSRAGVFVQFGEDFVADADGYVRINIACPRSVLQAALERMCGALRAL